MHKKEPVDRTSVAVKDSELLLFDNWMTVSEFAAHLKISRAQVYVLMQHGLPYFASPGATERKGTRRIPFRRASEWLEKRIKS